MTGTPGPDLLIRGGTVILPTGQKPADIAVTDGVITAIGSEVRAGAEVVDARNLIVLPGVVDAHVHFNEPGRADWEGWEAGTRGAAAGGVTTVLEMPLNAHPPTTTPDAFDQKLESASAKALVDFGLWGGLIDDNLGELPTLAKRGVVGFKAFMCDSGIDDFPRASDDTLELGLTVAAGLGLVVGVHAEDQELVTMMTRTMQEENRTDRRAWCIARQSVAEYHAITSLAACMERVGREARVHVVHVSSPEALAEIHAARGRGLAMTAETCPHYLAFTSDDFERIGPALKCAPPVRSPAQRERLWQEIGRVHLIASDHSPCPAAAKHAGEHDIWQAWGGVSGIQMTLPVLLTEAFHARGFSLGRIAHLTATSPAKLFGLYPRKGVIAVGADADFAIVDPMRRWTFESADLETRSGISPYLGCGFTGKVLRTIVRGTTVFADGRVVGKSGGGRFVRPHGLHEN